MRSLTLVLVVPCLIVVGLMVYTVWQVIARGRRFRKRPAMHFEEWFQQECRGRQLNPELVRMVLEALAQDINVDPSQFRLRDSFDREFALGARWVGLSDIEKEDFPDAVVAIVRYHGVKDWKWPGRRGKTLGNLLEEIDRAVREHAKRI